MRWFKKQSITNSKRARLTTQLVEESIALLETSKLVSDYVRESVTKDSAIGSDSLRHSSHVEIHFIGALVKRCHFINHLKGNAIKIVT